MKRIPNTPNTLIERPHGLRDLFQPLPTSIPQQQSLFQYLPWFEVAHADGLFAAVDVGAFYDGVFARARRDGDFDLGVCFCEAREGGFEEGARGVVG